MKHNIHYFQCLFCDPLERVHVLANSILVFSRTVYITARWPASQPQVSFSSRSLVREHLPTVGRYLFPWDKLFTLILV